MPPDGAVAVNADDARVVEARSAAPAGAGRARRSRSTTMAAIIRRADIEHHGAGTDFTLLESGNAAGRLRSPLSGAHNVRNALGAIALARGSA